MVTIKFRYRREAGIQVGASKNRSTEVLSAITHPGSRQTRQQVRRTNNAIYGCWPFSSVSTFWVAWPFDASSRFFWGFGSARRLKSTSFVIFLFQRWDLGGKDYFERIFLSYVYYLCVLRGSVPLVCLFYYLRIISCLSYTFLFFVHILATYLPLYPAYLTWPTSYCLYYLFLPYLHLCFDG